MFIDIAFVTVQIVHFYLYVIEDGNVFLTTVATTTVAF